MVIETFVVLTYEIEGAQLRKGKYDSKGMTTSRPQLDDCRTTVRLGSSFVQHSISRESRPDRNKYYKAWANWLKMTEKDRLQWHIIRYVKDFNGVNFEFRIV